MRVYWWTCPHPACFDRMAESGCEADVVRDRDAHIACQHPGWEPSDRQAAISTWLTQDAS